MILLLSFSLSSFLLAITTDVAWPMVVPTSYVFGDGLSLFIAYSTKFYKLKKKKILLVFINVNEFGTQKVSPSSQATGFVSILFRNRIDTQSVACSDESFTCTVQHFFILL